MTEAFPTHKQVVIIGGGIIGCSVAYHLTKLGWTDVVIVERKTLTSGTKFSTIVYTAVLEYRRSIALRNCTSSY